MARHFYITFATHTEHWSGHLTIGQHYWWTSAHVGDAHLLDTEECSTFEEAIVALKAEMTNLCRVVCRVNAERRRHPHEGPSLYGLLNRFSRTSTTVHIRICASSLSQEPEG